jgi:hypothetical protein
MFNFPAAPDPEPTGLFPSLFEPTNYQREVVASGKSVFEVTWSVSVSTTQKFSNPKIESVQHIETVWE